ncbi:glycosyltransferase family 2 protein [Streptomyces canus]|uniref:glycosyltransferase family 2 protein n=1 Tax=Streptomyces canus TaxID=58343 RepID=UPI0036CA490F
MKRSVPSVDIVIVNWNTGHHLRACVRSIARADRSRLRVARILVVDNASADGSAEDLADAGTPPAVTVLRNTRNRGFAAACNQGAEQGDSEFLLFLNPDTELYPDTLLAVGDFLHTSAAARVGICGGRMVDERGRPEISCSRFPTLRIFLGKATGLSRLFPALFPPHHLRPAETTASRPVDQVIGAFFLLRRTLFESLGGFDEGYFLYFEETDLALRARRAGLGSYYLHPARVHHVGQVSSAQLGSGRLCHSLCSRTRYAFRHWPRSRAWLLVALTLTVELAARLARDVVRGRPSEWRATLAGYRGYAHALPAITRTTDSIKDASHVHHRPHRSTVRSQHDGAAAGADAARPGHRRHSAPAGPALPAPGAAGGAGQSHERPPGSVPSTPDRGRRS